MSKPYVDIADVPEAGDWILDQSDLALVVLFALGRIRPEEFRQAMVGTGWKPLHVDELISQVTQVRETT